MSDDEREALRRIERRIQWIGHTLIGCISIVVWHYIEYYVHFSDVWGLSADGRHYVGLGTGKALGFVLKAIFNRR